MNKKATAAGAILAIALIVILGMMILSGGFSDDLGNAPESIPYGPEPGGLSLTLIDTYGPLMLVVSILLFGAIIGGAAIARGEKTDGKGGDEE